MVADVVAARTWCEVNEREEELLTSRQRPIVLLRQQEGATGQPCVADGVAPKEKTLGIMLPYTPLHHLLLEAVARPIVLTSGNVSDEPIVYRDDEARETLKGIADAYARKAASSSSNDMIQLCACVPFTGIPKTFPAITFDVPAQPPT